MAPSDATETRLDRRPLLAGLTNALGAIAASLDTQGDAAGQVALLVPQAQILAERARALATLPYPAGGTFSALTAELHRFVAHTVAVAEQAAREASAARDIARTLMTQAAGLHEASQSAARPDALRENLEAMLATLAPLPAQMAATHGIATDVAVLGQQASAIATRAETLQEPTRQGGAAALALYRTLRGFADAAEAVATGMAASNDQMRQVVAEMRDQTRELVRAAPRGQPMPPTRLSDLPRGMVWKKGPFWRR